MTSAEVGKAPNFSQSSNVLPDQDDSGIRMGASVDCFEKPSHSGDSKDELFTIGNHSFLNKKRVFSRFVDERPEYAGQLQRWFAARIEGKSDDGQRFIIRWYEGDELAEADPEDVVAASEYLQPGVLVQIPDIHDGSVDEKGNVFKSDFYQEVRVVRKSETDIGAYKVRGKRGLSFHSRVTEIMVDQGDMDRHLKRIPPIPFDKLLNGYVFSTTHPNKGHRSTSRREEAEARAYDLDVRIEMWIVEMGGKLVTDFEELTDCELTNPKKRFLIASGCCRTQRYLQCLVANVPCVHYHWLKNFYNKGKLVDFEKYRLPAGVDRKGREIKWTERKSLLDNLRTGFYAVSLDGWEATSANWWMPVIEAGRGEPILLAPREPVLEDVDVVIVRTHVPKKIKAACDEAMIPVVMEDWLLESIVLGKKQPFSKYLPEQI